MAEIVNIASLDLDVNSLLKKATETKKAISDLSDEQKKLKDSGQQNSEQFVKNETHLKSLKTQYNEQTKAVSSLISADGSLVKSEEALSVALDKQNLSINDARKSNTELLKIRNQLDLSTKEGEDALALINSKIDDNNKFIKTNVSELEKQKIGIGDYATGVKGALSELLPLNGATAQYSQLLSSFSGLFDKLKNDFATQINLLKNSTAETQNLSGAQRAGTIVTNGLTASTKAFGTALIAIGIGAIILVVGLLISYFKTFTPIVDKVEQAFAGLGAGVKVVQQTLVKFIENIKSAGDFANKFSAFLRNPIDALKEMGKEMENAGRKAIAFKKAEQDLQDAIEEQEVASAKNRAEINRLNILAKDRTKTENERLVLLQRAQNLETEDFNKRKANVQTELKLAQEKIIQEAKLTENEANELRKRGVNYKEFVEKRTNNTDELFTKLKEALLKDTEVYNEYSVNLEKNINKQNKLEEDKQAKREKAQQETLQKEQEVAQARQQTIDKEIQKQNEALALFIAQQGTKAKTLEEELALEQKLSEKRLKILEYEFKNGKISKTAYETEKLNISNEFAEKQREVAVQNIDKMLQDERAKLPEIIKDGKIQNDAKLKNEIDRLTELQRLESEALAKKKEIGEINETEYQQGIDAIKLEFQNKRDDAEKLRLETQKEIDAFNLENKRAIEDQIFQDDLQIKLERLEQERLLEVAQAEKLGADLDLVNQKYSNKKNEILKKDLENKKKAQLDEVRMNLQGFNQLLGGLEAFFGKSKNIAIAQALVNGGLAITEILAQKSELPTVADSIFKGLKIATAVGTTARSISDIRNAKYEGGGVLQGARHSQGGIPTPFGELEGGEAVINRKSTAMFMPLLSEINQAGGGVKFETGGIMNKVLGNTEIVDYNKLAQAVASLPPPVVYVEDINVGQSNVAQVVSYGTF